MILITSDSVVLPAVRIPKKLWKYLEKLMEKKMFASKADLLKEALREYLENHKTEIDITTIKIVDSRLLLEKERVLEKAREDELLEWTEKIRTR
ncbi:MAG TPA: ribbon-helix-helix domain-containing protein [Candidatus Deferrimicrobium sp.]|nr:ribbon-helix-helix domain-containing protein [Candidatus Deferrimicrobium sp.]